MTPGTIRTRGATVASIACWAFGALGVLSALGMMGVVPLPHEDSPLNAGSMPTDAPVFAFGAIRAVASAAFVVVGWGLWRMRPWSRLAALAVAVAAIAINVAEPLLFFHGFPRELLLPTIAGSLWPAILIVACLHPDWRAAYSDSARLPS